MGVFDETFLIIEEASLNSVLTSEGIFLKNKSLDSGNDLTDLKNHAISPSRCVGNVAAVT